MDRLEAFCFAIGTRLKCVEILKLLLHAFLCDYIAHVSVLNFTTTATVADTDVVPSSGGFVVITRAFQRHNNPNRW